MSSPTTTSPTAATAPIPRSSVLRTALILIGVILVAVAINALVALIATVAGAPSDYGPLRFPAYATLTAVGVLAGWVGWIVVSRRSKNPRRMLTILVPLVTLLSFTPDVLLLVLGFIPGTTTVAVVALMVMHLVVVALAVPGYVLASRGHRAVTLSDA